MVKQGAFPENVNDGILLEITKREIITLRAVVLGMSILV